MVRSVILPFSRKGQENEAGKIDGDLAAKGLSVIHVFTFPALTINHSVVMFRARRSEENTLFRACDPNSPDQALEILFDRRKRLFSMPPTAYFIGGPVKVYRVFSGLFH